MAEKKTSKTKKQVARVTGGRLNVRKAPEVNAEIVRILQNEEKIEVLSIDGEWAKIKDGYVVNGYLIYEQA